MARLDTQPRIGPRQRSAGGGDPAGSAGGAGSGATREIDPEAARASRKPPASRWLHYAVYAAAWTLVGAFFFTQELARKIYWGDPAPWWRYLTSWMLGAWLAALLTPVVVWLGRRWPIERRGWPRRLLLHGVSGLVLSALQIVTLSALATWLGFLGPLPVTRFGETLRLLAVISFHNNVVSYWTILCIQYGVRWYRRYQERAQHAARLELQASELETQLVRARLGALKMQLQPHFLFNTMNAIMVLVRQQRGAEAEETLARLSDLLRFVLDDALVQEVPLHRELAYLRLYLSIEQLRFADRLRVEIDAAPDVLDATLPHMALQPIVENAIRHGIAHLEDGGTLRLTARRIDDALVIEVCDDGPGFGAPAPAPRDDQPAGRGIGLDNTRARLHQLYGDRASLTIAAGAPTGTVVRIALPLRLDADAPRAAA